MVNSTAVRTISEDELDPSGRYVVTHRWGDRLVLGPDEWRERDVFDADAYAEETGRWRDIEDLEPGQLYDRTMDLFYPVARWVAMRAEIAEAERKRVTLAKVERMPDRPRSPWAVEAVAVTEDGARHGFTVATDRQWCAECGQHRHDHDGGAAREAHAYQRDPARFSNEIAFRWFMRLEFPAHEEMPPWMEAAYRAWSPESVELAEVRHAGEISADEFDDKSAVLTWPWWRWHDASWQGWSERADRDKRIRKPGNYTTFPTTIKRSGRGAF